MTKTFLECCETVRDKGLHMIRTCEKMPGQYEICTPFEHEEGWIWLDAVTANVVCQVCEALSSDKREKFRASRRSHSGPLLESCQRTVTPRYGEEYEYDIE